MTGSIPLGRYGEVEIAGAVSFPAGPAASYITGTTLNVDRGQDCLRHRGLPH
jgi:3-oxoacyl-[acyl-carrier protein] reductase